MEKGWAVVKKRNEKIRSAFVLLVFLGFFVFFGPISLMDGSKTPPIAGLGPLTAFIITELFLLFLYRKLVGKDFDNGKSYMGINISNNGIILKNDKETIEVQLDQVVGVLFYIKSRDPNGIPVFAVFNLANGKDLTFDGSSKTPPERADIFNKIKASVSTTKIFTHNF